MKKSVKKTLLLVNSIIASLVVIAGIFLLYRTFQKSAAFFQSKDPVSSFPDKKVLFITSFNDEVPEVSMQKEGMLSVFNEANVWLDVMSMNSRDYPGEENESLFRQLLKYRLENHSRYDAIIAGDDEALYFVEKNQEELFKDLPVYFLGVNDIDHAHEAVNLDV